MNRRQLVAAIICGILAAASLIFYITTCGWQIKELLLVLAAVTAAFGFGLLIRVDA